MHDTRLRLLGAFEITPEHLLLGLMRGDPRLATRLLPRFHLSAESLRSEILNCINQRAKLGPETQIALAEETKRVLSRADEQRALMGDEHVQTEHVWLALIVQDQTLTARVLNKHGMGIDHLREAVIELREIEKATFAFERRRRYQKVSTNEAGDKDESANGESTRIFRSLPEVPSGLDQQPGFQTHKDVIHSIAWSPDGTSLASSDSTGMVRVWTLATRSLQHSSDEHLLEKVYAVAWSPDGRRLASAGQYGIVRFMDSQTGESVSTLRGGVQAVYDLAWSPDGENLACAGADGIVRVWDVDKRELKKELKGHSDAVYSVAWSQNGHLLASGGRDQVINVWDVRSMTSRHSLVGHTGAVSCLAWSPDGSTIASGGWDRNVRFWDASAGNLALTVEGHTGRLRSVAFSPCGQILASKSEDGTVQFWRTQNGANIGVLTESGARSWPTKITFHPTKPILATLGEEDTSIRLWSLDLKALLGRTDQFDGISYTNAKVVLMGETGVGKTALGVRLTEGVWRPTPGSTHGMNVWSLYSEAEREVMLWDFAGQDEYRLVHQLFLNETNVALLLYDPTRSNDTFLGVEYWERALRNAVPSAVQLILVAARVDVGGVRMTSVDINAYCESHGILAHYATSAETNEGCDQLRSAVMAAIPWDQLPRTRSPEIFKRIKVFLTAVRQGNRMLVRESDLFAEFAAQMHASDSHQGEFLFSWESHPTERTQIEATEAEFHTVIGHVETAGLIKRLSFGDFLLLKPELLNSYAADIVDAARRHPHGLGAVRKGLVLDGGIRLKDQGGLRDSDKIFLLHATVELFLRLGLALEQDGNLVFPSKFNTQMPALAQDPVVEVEFNFEGPVESLYTTLVVKLYYGGIFRLKKLWKNAAEFLNAREAICGLQLQSDGDGRGILKVFYAERLSDDDKALFLKIVADHFEDKGVSVQRQRIYRCSNCCEVARELAVVGRAIDKQKTEIFCQDCGSPIPLVDALEVLYRDDVKFLSQILSMESQAERNIERGGVLVSAAAELRTEDFNSWAGGADIATVAIVFTDILNSTGLNVRLGDEAWSQIRKSHFAHASRLIQEGEGYLVKTMGDSVMVAFHSSSAALDFAIALSEETGDKSITIRAGIHIGPVEVSMGDVFGQHVSMAARVEAKAHDGGIWVSERVKQDIDALRAARHSELKWIEHPDQDLKGFPQSYTLWSIKPEQSAHWTQKDV